MSILWLSLAILILICGYISLPSLTGRIINATEVGGASATSDPAIKENAELDKKRMINRGQLFTLIVLALAVGATSYASFLLARAGMKEIESTARLNGLADALCLADNDLDKFQKASGILVPESKYLSSKELFTIKDIKAVTDLVKPSVEIPK